MESPSRSFISLLHEYQQKTHCTMEFEEGSTEGPSHNKTFTMRAIVNGQRFPDGTGKSKQEAKQSAAKNALDALRSSPSVESTTSSVQNISNNMNIPSRYYTCWLNEHSQKNRLLFKARETNKMDPGNSTQLCTYVCKFVCGDREFPEAYGNNKKEAKEAAACRVYEELCKTQNTEVFDENSSKAQGSEVAACSASLDRLSLSIADDSRSSTPDHNYIAYLNNFCQKNKLVHDFQLVERRGPPHNPEFVYKVVIDGKEYPEGQGKSSKEAKQHAAQRAWSELQDQSGWTTQAGPFRNSAIASLDRLSLSIADDSRSSVPDNNYIAYLNNFCQQNKQIKLLDFKLVDQSGPAHTPEFVYKVVIDGKEYPEGQGKNSKEAKQHAAQRAWSELQDQSGWTTQSSEDDTSSQTQETTKSEDARLSSNIPCKTPSSSDNIIFKDSAVSSPMAKCPTLSPLDARPKIRLAANFHLSPNPLAQSKEKPEKPPGGQTSSQAIKSRFLEDFDLISPLGNGTYGRVFKARRKLENKYYAVKIVKSRKKAGREVNALALFNNANIVRYYSAWKEETEYRHESSESNSFSDSGSGPGTEFLYIQMELCEGDTLRAWIDKRNFSKESFPERRADAARISGQVLTAVDYIHSKGLIHRDLKPANIMFSSDGGVKVGDFGLVTAAENDNDERLPERTIDTGSPLYMAPEQVIQNYDKEVDIYALGLVYFELLWKLGSVTERNKIWTDLRNRNFPPEFSKKYSFEHKLIERMLSANPEDRPDATELIRELDQYISPEDR